MCASLCNKAPIFCRKSADGIAASLQGYALICTRLKHIVWETTGTRWMASNRQAYRPQGEECKTEHPRRWWRPLRYGRYRRPGRNVTLLRLSAASLKGQPMKLNAKSSVRCAILLSASLAFGSEAFGAGAQSENQVMGGKKEPTERAVQIGLDGPASDACGGFGKIANLNPRGDNYLSVRIAPSTNARETDRLGPDKSVIICEDAKGWVGIVYPSASDDTGQCSLDSPVTERRSYRGSCRSGWVSKAYVAIIAG